MKELADGRISYAGPLLRFSTDKVELEVLEGQSVTGDFKVASAGERRVRGVVYTSGMRMNCLTPQFEGEEAVIRYEFHSEGLHEGNIEKGYFYLVCDQCEYSLSFVVTVTRPYATGSLGKVRTLKDFQKLAAASWDEAAKIYASSQFKSTFGSAERRERLLYEALSGTHFPSNSMNEFLIASAGKEPTDFAVEDTHIFEPAVTEDVEETVKLIATGYGELHIAVTSDHPAVSLPQEIVTRDDFIGSACALPFRIKKSGLHAGKNFARLTFRSINRTEVVDLEILSPERSEEEKKERERRLEIKRCRIRLTEDYLNYRLKRIVTGEWAKKTIDLCRHLSALDPDSPWYVLMQAQAFLVNKQKQEARWILDAFRKEGHDPHTPVYGYFLYLCTLSERESAYVDKLTDEIEEIYYENPDDLVLFWILLFLREDLCESDEKRLSAIRGQCERGAKSPFLYMEAYYQMWLDPHALERLGSFEIQVLFWAAKRDALSKDLALRIGALTDTKREFDPLLYRLLCMTYEKFPRDDLVQSVCAYLIRTEHYAHRYFYWFERGVELNLRITGLAEAYLLSMDIKETATLPKIIEMYFQYSSSLPKEKKAELFARITKEKARDPKLYLEYRRGIESFALDEIANGNISDDLAVIYDDLMQEGLINAEIASAMEELMFTYQAVVPNENIVWLVILHEELKAVQRVPVRSGVAYFQLVTNHYSVVAEDAEGRRYSALTAGLTLKRLMNPVKYLPRCMEYAPGRLFYALHHLSGKERFRESLFPERENLRLLMSSDRITEDYKLKLCPLLVRLYDDYSDPEELSAYLRIIDGKKLPTESRVELTELLIEKRMYQEAYQMLQQFGTEQVDPGKLVPLVSFKIESVEYNEDDFLTALALEAFKSHKYNDILLTYLVKNLSAPTDDMELVWRTAKDFDIETFELEERLLVQALFSARLSPGAQSVFESYAKSGGRQLVIEAFLNYFAYLYFVREAVVPEDLLDALLRRYLDGVELTDVCKLAVLKYYAENRGLQEEYEEQIDTLLSECVEQELYFAFYRRLPERLLEKYQLYDKTFLEFRTDPKHKVRLHYALSEKPDEYVSEELISRYGGIFVRQFVLFFGESVQYYITEEDEGIERVVVSDQIQSVDVYGEKKETRFSLLNEILLHHTLREEQELLKSLHDYEAKRAFVRKSFTAL